MDDETPEQKAAREAQLQRACVALGVRFTANGADLSRAKPGTAQLLELAGFTLSGGVWSKVAASAAAAPAAPSAEPVSQTAKTRRMPRSSG